MQNRRIHWIFPAILLGLFTMLSFICETEESDLPSLTTTPVSGLTSTTASTGGDITDDGGAAVTARGVVWATTPNPAIGDNEGMTNDGAGTGAFTSAITGLTPGTPYYVRAYATNSEGTAYGNQVSFNTPGPAVVTTAAIGNINQTSATGGGEVVSEGGSAVTARGVCYNSNPGPTLDDHYTVDGSGPGVFTSSLTGLTAGKPYYVRAYATNSEGTAYGNQVEFTTDESGATGQPCPGMPTVTDIDGNVYNTVQIGNRCWMKENLKTTKYRSGATIENATDGAVWAGLATGAYVWYDNDISYRNLYGALYNWYAVSNPEGLCPAGWHVPTDADWTELKTATTGHVSPNGNKLKSCRQAFSPLGGDCNTNDHPRWDANATHYGTDDSGFAGLPGGYRTWASGSFYNLGQTGQWWSSIDHSSFDGWAYWLLYSDGALQESYLNKHYGYSVRCVRDD